uniref:CSON014598 protein n=1 Tax=Culicoides sonorensis TaxID=179676 RepID=A0A336KUJ0_CULSO
MECFFCVFFQIYIVFLGLYYQKNKLLQTLISNQNKKNNDFAQVFQCLPVSDQELSSTTSSAMSNIIENSTVVQQNTSFTTESSSESSINSNETEIVLGDLMEEYLYENLLTLIDTVGTFLNILIKYNEDSRNESNQN